MQCLVALSWSVGAQRRSNEVETGGAPLLFLQQSFSDAGGVPI
jgi:hypothetical protein